MSLYEPLKCKCCAVFPFRSDTHHFNDHGGDEGEGEEVESPGSIP